MPHNKRCLRPKRGARLAATYLVPADAAVEASVALMGRMLDTAGALKPGLVVRGASPGRIIDPQGEVPTETADPFGSCSPKSTLIVSGGPTGCQYIHGRRPDTYPSLARKGSR